MLKGIGLKLAATFVFVVMWALVKAAAPKFPASEIVFFRSAFAMATLAVWLAARGEWPDALKTARPLGHIGRSLAGSAGIFANFIALALLPLADATAFTFVAPLIVAPLAIVLLGEEARLVRTAAVAVGFGGVLLMLSGQFGEGLSSWLGAVVALAGAGASAIAIIQTRRLTRSEATGAIVFYFSSVTTTLSLAILLVAEFWPRGWPMAEFVAGQRLVGPGALEFLALVGIGVLGGCGQILMTQSYRFADATIVAALDYSAMIWATGLGFVVFGETPTQTVLLGAGVVVAAGVAMLWGERRARVIRVGIPAGRA
jgi:drug/metabolite transporter (DMT)-like permease